MQSILVAMAFCLQGWLTEDHTTVLLDDELDEMEGVGNG